MRATLQRSVELLARGGAAPSTGGSRSPAFRALFFGLSFFHAVVQERRRFGPLGWNIRYQFNDNDLETSSNVLQHLLEEAGPDGAVPWDALRFLTGHIHYGGRVTDDWDRRCLMTIFDKFISSALLRGDCSFTPSGAYRAPRDTSLPAMKTHVAQFPAADPPEVFGMHPNADVGFQEQVRPLPPSPPHTSPSPLRGALAGRAQRAAVYLTPGSPGSALTGGKEPTRPRAGTTATDGGVEGGPGP